MNSNFQLSSIFRYCLAALMGCTTGTVNASDWFNPAFLSGGGGEVADLSRFENNDGQAPGTYRVDIWLNDEFVTTSNIRFEAKVKKNILENKSRDELVDDSGLTPCLSIKWLKRLGVNTAMLSQKTNEKSESKDEDQYVDFLSVYPGSSAHYDFSSQRLLLTFPQAAIQNSIRGYIPPEEWDQGINAGLLNYSFTGDNGSEGDTYYLNITGGVNIGSWRLRHNGAWNYSDYKHGRKSNHWQSISTHAERTIIPLRGQLLLGDGNSSGDIFESTGFRGASLTTSDQMYPDSQQGFAPTVRGIASGRSTVSVRQNGYLIYQNIVQAGAFEITDLNPTTSSGDLEVTVESDAGNVQKYVVPYSSVPMLLREGRLKYEVVAGRYRSGSPDKNEPFFVQGTLARGLSGSYTLYGGTQLANNYRAIAVGIGGNLGHWGAVSADVTGAWSQLADDSHNWGESLRFLYAKSLNDYGTNFQLLGYRYSTKGFYTLDDVAWASMEGYQYGWKKPIGEGNEQYEPLSYHNLRYSKKGRFQLNISQQLGDVGSLYLAGSQQSYWNTSSKDTWYQAGFASSAYGVNYNLSYSMNKNSGMPGRDHLLSLNISIPFGRWLGKDMSDRQALNNMYATSQASRDQDGVNQVMTGVSGTLLSGNNLSYSLMQGHSNKDGNNSNINADWQGTYGRVGAGYNHNRYNHSVNYSVSGGALVHANGITLGQPLGNTNILVKAAGAKGVQVENEIGVKTDWRGYAVVPYATVYRRNRIALDVNSLDMHTDLEDNVRDVVPTQGAIVRAEYQAHVGTRALLTLKRNDGRLVPFGAVVSEKNTDATGIVSELGQVYLTGIPLSGYLTITWGNGVTERCGISYSIPANSNNQPVVRDVLTCIQGEK